MLTIESEPLNHNFIKHHIKGAPFHASLNQFIGPDEGDVAHCHPYNFRTTIIEKGYVERVYQILPDGSWRFEEHFREPGTVQVVKAETIHQIIALPHGECWTLFQPLSGHIRTSQEWMFNEEGIWVKNWNEEKFRPYL